jgi:hypothetical protein
MKTIILFLLLCASASAKEYIYEGPWHTDNRPLNGDMIAVINYNGKETWTGRFYGVWNQAPFDYTVDFTGPATKLKGSALIDGASYNWTGTIDKDTLKVDFTGSRYYGSFDMKRKRK